MIFLYILAALILLIFFLLLIKIKVSIVYQDKVKITAKWLWFDILPKKKEKTQSNVKSQKSQTKKKPVKKQKPFKKFISDFLKANDFETVMGILKQILNYTGILAKSFWKHLVFKNLKIKCTVSDGDPALTAQKYGKVCAICFPLSSFLISNSNVKKYDVSVEPDFITQASEIYIEADLSIRTIFVLNAVIAYLFRLIFKILIKILFRKAATENERKNGSCHVRNNNRQNQGSC